MVYGAVRCCSRCGTEGEVIIGNYLNCGCGTGKSKTGAPTEITKDGTRIWRNEAGQYHREDGPAIEHADGEKWWYFQGGLHREGGPAIEWADGYKAWWTHGELIREEKP